MLDLLRQISVTCFFTSYVVVLGLELIRLVGQVPGRALAVLSMTAVGIFTHVVYLTLRASAITDQSNIGRLATWTDWSLMLALGLAIAFFFFYLQRPDTVIGLFFMPMVLALIGLAVAVIDQPAFDRGEATQLWRNVHAISMMVGTAAVLFGFIAGMMYLVQSWRLKQKRTGSKLRLPTLETLQNLNRRCLVASTASVAVGFVSGVVMNWNRYAEIPWTSGGIVFSAVLFIWLATATIVEFTYAPASRGRKIAYLTLASFVFLALAVWGVLSSSHGQPTTTSSLLKKGSDPLRPLNFPTPERGLQRARPLFQQAANPPDSIVHCKMVDESASS